MGWGIYLYPEIYYSKVNYKSKEDVEIEIENVKSIINMLETKLYGLVVTTEPQKMMSQQNIDNGYSPFEWISHEYDEIITNPYSEATLKDYYYQLFKLELLYNSWDIAHNKDGQAIMPPKGSFEYPRNAYMDVTYKENVYENEVEID